MTEEMKQEAQEQARRERGRAILASCVRAELADREIDDTPDTSEMWICFVAEMLAAANGCPATVTEIAEAILCDAEIAS